MAIPSQFIIQRYVRGPESKLCAFIQSFTEVSAEHGARVSFSILPIENKQPHYIKKKQEHWGSLRIEEVLPTCCTRYISERPEPYEFHNSIWYEGYVVNLNGRDIPIFNMDQACQILPAIFSRLIEPKYHAYQLNCYTVAPRVCKDPVAELDTYFLKHSEDVCPITMLPLSKFHMCLTPCGHGMDFAAMSQWLEIKDNCPVCRTQCTPAELIVYPNLI